MLSEWGKWQPTIWEAMGMDPVFIAILEKNEPDVEAIISIIGLANFFKMLPHIKNILETVKAAQGAKK